MIWPVIVNTLISGAVFAYELNVPGEFATLEEAVKHSREGDAIIVAPGIYRLGPENITIDREHLTLKSLYGPSKTVIEGWGNKPVIKFSETSRAVIEGFTITSMNSHDGLPLRGGGIYCAYSSSPIIMNNIITGNSAVFGGGIFCDEETSPIIVNNSILRNKATRFGGGVFSYKAKSTIVNNRITENSASNSGGGLFCDRDSPYITNNIIWRNKAGFGGGISCDRSFSVITNNTITENKAESGGGIIFEGGTTRISNVILWNNMDDLSSRTVSSSSRPVFSDIGDGDFRGLNGNISTDPLFVDPDDGDFRLSPKSPCINAGNPEETYNDPDGSINDMGAFGGPRANYLRGGKL